MTAPRMRIVLVRPQHPGNVGAACRAMANMGLADLVLVAPRFPDLGEAATLARNAAPLLDGARIAATLADALADCHLAVGATRRHGRYRKRLRPVHELMPQLAALPAHHQVALIFGSESDGLLLDEIARCDELLSIPADPHYESLNLAQAVLLAAWEWRRAMLAAADPPDAEPRATAPHASPGAGHAALDRLVERWTPILWDCAFLLPRRHRHSLMRFRQVLAQAARDGRDWRLLMALADKIRYALRHPPPTCGRMPARASSEHDTGQHIESGEPS